MFLKYFLLLICSGCTLCDVRFPDDRDLAVFLPEWRGRERIQRDAFEHRAGGVHLDGDQKTHGEEKQKCPDPSVIKPCQCERKTSGLDMTCENVNVEKLERVTRSMKKHNRNSKVEYLVSYFKIRNCQIDRLPDYIFMGLKIIHLMIYNCQLKSMSPNSLSSIASQLKHLVLSNNQLQEVPSKALRQLRELDHLNINQNNITIIKDNAFWGLSKVTRLSLYDNKISRIHAGAFDGLTKDLLRLNVGRNALHEIPKEALHTLKNLNQLDMSENKLRTITPNDFKGMDRLDTLSINHNLLTHLGPGWLEGMPRLTSLSLDYNKINKVDNGAFQGLEEQLQSLSLASNKISTFPTRALRPLHQLTTLHLDDNNIHTLEENAFNGFGEHIKNLWLQNNHIPDVPQNSFEDLHSLEWLKLYNNELKTLHYEVMEPILDTLKHIDIHSNPLVCDCELRWYKLWYTSEWQDIDTDYIKDTHCVDPTDNREHKMADVDLNHMFCDLDEVSEVKSPNSGDSISFCASHIILVVLVKQLFC